MRMRAIDGDALMAKLGIGQDCSVCKHDDTPYCCWKPDAVDVCEAICDAPTIEPRKKGKWIERESGTEDKEYGFETVIVCSCCDFPATTFYSEDCESRTQIRTDFCPNCGAEMTEGEG